VRLGKASVYAVYAVVHIAGNQAEGAVAGRARADTCGMPVEYLLKILQHLVKARVLHSARGRAGGFQLCKPADETTLLEVIEAVEGPLLDETMVTGDVRGAGVIRATLNNLCGDIAGYAQATLSKTSVSQLIATA